MCTYSISVDATILERVKPVLPDDKAVEAGCSRRGTSFYCNLPSLYPVSRKHRSACLQGFVVSLKHPEISTISRNWLIASKYETAGLTLMTLYRTSLLLPTTSAVREIQGPSSCCIEDRTKAEYVLRVIAKPIGVSGDELGQALPSDLRSSLPSIEEIEAELE